MEQEISRFSNLVRNSANRNTLSTIFDHLGFATPSNPDIDYKEISCISLSFTTSKKSLKFLGNLFLMQPIFRFLGNSTLKSLFFVRRKHRARMGTTGEELSFQNKPPKFDAIFDLGNPDIWQNYSFSLEKTFPDENKPAPDGKFYYQVHYLLSFIFTEVCKYFLKGTCMLGNDCPLRHAKGDKAVVCKHWLRALCKKDDHCEFLHEFRMDKMPECHFFANFGKLPPLFLFKSTQVRGYLGTRWV